jgi:hypothetical protein
MLIFNGVRKCPEFENGLSPGSVVEMSGSAYINEVLFLLWLWHFKKYSYKTPGTVLLILGKYGNQ